MVHIAKLDYFLESELYLLCLTELLFAENTPQKTKTSRKPCALHCKPSYVKHSWPWANHYLIKPYLIFNPK